MVRRGYLVNNFDGTWDGPNTRGGQFLKVEPHIEVLLADIFVRFIYQHTLFCVIFITEVPASFYQTRWQWAVQARSDPATSTGVFWPLTGGSEEDVYFEDKGIWREPDVCDDLGVWRYLCESFVIQTESYISTRFTEELSVSTLCCCIIMI